MAIVRASTNWVGITNAISDSRDAGAGWSQAGWATTLDGLYAVSNMQDGWSHWLRGRLARWATLTPPPVGAVLTGIECRMTGHYQGGNSTAEPAGMAGLWDTLAAARIGTAKAGPLALSPVANGDGQIVWGGADDLWGTSLDMATVLADGFEFEIRVDGAAKAHTAEVDYMDARLWYSFDNGAAGAGPGLDGSLTLLESTGTTYRAFNTPYQPHPLRDVRVSAAILATLGLTETGSVELWAGPDQSNLFRFDYDAAIVAGQDRILRVGMIVPAGWWVEYRTENTGAAYDLHVLTEQVLLAHDVHSVLWTTDRDPTTAPVSTSHRHLAGLDVVDELTLDQYRRDPAEGYRNLDSAGSTLTFRGTGYVRGTDLHMKGQRSDGDSTITVEYDGVVYTTESAELTFPTSTTWEWIGPAGTETTPGSEREFKVSSTAGAIPKDALVCVDRTAPTASLASDMTYGLDAGTPLLRGEYARWTPTYSDDNCGVDLAQYQYAHAGYWTGEPSNAGASGAVGGWVRSASGAPVTGSTTVTLSVTDKAGNNATSAITVHFGALPAVSVVTTDSIDSANERPAHLSSVDYAQTAYDDNLVTVTLSWAPAVSACRNSNNDDTSAGVRSGTLTVTPSAVLDVAGLLTVQDSVAVPAQADGLGLSVIGRTTDQHYRNHESSPVGDFGYNAGRATDFNQDQAAGNPDLPFTGKAIEPFTDENPLVSAVSATILGGVLTWDAATGNAAVVVAVSANNGQRFRPRLIGTNGLDLLYGTYGSDLDVQLWDGTQYVTADTADTFGPNSSYDIAALAGATTVQVKISRLTAAGPDLGAVAMNFIA